MATRVAPLVVVQALGASPVTASSRWSYGSRGGQAWRAFVTPNPSPANASCALPALVRWFDALAVFLPPVEAPLRRR